MLSRTIALACLLLTPSVSAALEPIPDKLVVLTFDDSVKSHYTVVRPILKKYGFGATFFITEGFDFPTNKKDYMTWPEIATLARDGFEIGNHTRDHLGINGEENVAKLAEQVRAINERCKQYGIDRPVSFAWPGNAFDVDALPILRQQGILFARRGVRPEADKELGQGFAYQAALDHPLLIPSAGNARPDWTIADFITAVEKARYGRIAVLQFHGVPDLVHPWVHTTPENFEAYMEYLSKNDYRVIAMRDLTRYVEPDVAPKNPLEVIEDRQSRLAAGRSLDNFRRPKNEKDLCYWLTNMAFHQFTTPEMCAATGMSAEAVESAFQRFGIDRQENPTLSVDDSLLVLPYPGGRHPRRGFLDGEIRPQRETKASVFTPWADGGYVVLDIPEAIWWTPASGRELLYLAHTHVPTKWSKRGLELAPLEWTRHNSGSLSVERLLPNQVTFGATITPSANAVHMTMSIHNDSKETLSGLRVQNCVMLKSAVGFDQLTTENKIISHPYVACRNETGDRWIITAWDPCLRPWGNQICPCMHSDPQFPDCQPGQTQHLRGWLSFYEGTDLQSELIRIEKTGWRSGK